MVQVLWPTCQVPWPLPVTIFSPGKPLSRVPCSPNLHLFQLQLSYQGGPGMVHTRTPRLMHTLAVLLWWPQHSLSLLHLQLAIRVALVVICSRNLPAHVCSSSSHSVKGPQCITPQDSLICLFQLQLSCQSGPGVHWNPPGLDLLQLHQSFQGDCESVPQDTPICTHFRSRQSAKVACCMQSTQGHSYIRPQRKLFHHYSRFLCNIV